MVSKIFNKKAELIAAQREKINQIKHELESAPITVSDGVFQCDKSSMDRMQRRLENWNAAAQTMMEDGQQRWRNAYNASLVFTQSQFADLIASIKAAQAARDDRLFVLAVELKAQLPLVADHPIFDKGSSLWQSVL